MVDKLWFNYVIFESKKKTYIGSTVNIERRLRQHNNIIKGGAKYTRNGIWEYYCILYDINHTKNTALSYEWHLKHVKLKYYNPKIKRKKALEFFLKNKIKSKYDHILFVSKKYIHLTPFVSNKVFIIYLDTTDTINNKIINKYINIVKLLNVYLKINTH
jgi:predicted GIY-YIG superfamily endonuclease